jgi:hypothetical protein
MPAKRAVFAGRAVARVDAASVDKKDPLPSQVVALCPWCGLFTADMHGSQEECIRALEGEVRRLSSILEQFKKAPNAVALRRREKS